MEAIQVEAGELAPRTRFGRTVREPKRYVPIETPLDDYSEEETDDLSEMDGDAKVLCCGDMGPYKNRKRRRQDSESDEDSGDESDTGSDLKGFIVDDDDEDEDYQESDEEEPEELFDSEADSDC